MAGVQSGLVLGVGEIVHVPGAVEVAALVDAAQALAQAEDHVVRVQRQGEGNGAILPGDGEEGDVPLGRG